MSPVPAPAARPARRGRLGARVRALRTRTVARLRGGLFMRLHMSLILLAVFLSGALVARLLLAAGVSTLWKRYALATLASYGVFFLCVRLWISYAQRELSTSGDVDVGSVDLGGDWSAAGARDCGASDCGGGDWDGAGASDCGGGDWAATGASDCGGGDWAAADAGSGGGGGGGFDLDVGDGEGLILILLLLVLAAIFGAALWVVWQAPLILSEAAFQLVLAGALTRATRRMDTPHWAGSVLRATVIPFLIVMALVVGSGAVAQRLCPGANRLTEVIECARRPAARPHR